MNIELPGDSLDYELITQGVHLSRNVPGMTCEIGLRRGGGTKYIMDAIADHCPNKVHIAIDPYGSIIYADKDDHFIRLDYTNDMRDESLPNVYAYAKLKRIHFIFINLEDSEFFTRYADGVPVYNEVKRIESEYSFVHFDGPHDVISLKAELDFFLPRTPNGGVYCFDDLGHYDHAKIEAIIFKAGFKEVAKTGRKGLYVKG